MEFLPVSANVYGPVESVRTVLQERFCRGRAVFHLPGRLPSPETGAGRLLQPIKGQHEGDGGEGAAPALVLLSLLLLSLKASVLFPDPMWGPSLVTQSPWAPATETGPPSAQDLRSVTSAMS